MLFIVNGEVVGDAEVRREADHIRADFLNSTNFRDPVTREMRLREAARDNVVERLLLSQAARGEMDGMDGMMRRVLLTAIRPKYPEVREFYQKHKQELWHPESVHAAHIVRNIEDDRDEPSARLAIEAALSELAGGADFAELADRISDCKGDGGNLGWFPRGQMVPEFDAVVFTLAPGTTSGIFRTRFGFHIARVFARKPEGIPNLAELRGQIEETILAQRQRFAVENFIAGLKRKAKIERIHESLLRP
jgi:hypothetical protein